MEKSVEEYMQKFKPEEMELIVRVDWCYKKGHTGEFRTLGNYYMAQARFDMALDVRSGKMIDTSSRCFHWLEWLAPKKRFGFKYGYKFKEGKLYRILVRENISKPTDKFKAYYVEQVLESDVKESMLDQVYILESQFEESVTDMAVLIKKSICSWSMNAGCCIPHGTYIASVNNNELNTIPGSITWIEKESKLGLKYKFEGMQAYNIRVRKSKTTDNSYLVVDVLGKVTDERLEKVKEEYKKTIIINDSLGKFVLNRNDNYFEGQIDYLGELCTAYLNVDEGSATADIQLDRLSRIYQELEKWDFDVKEYASNELLGLANEWLDDTDRVTKEEFMQRIGVPNITIEPNGAIRLMFNSDGIFTDHGIEVEIDKDEHFICADIVE